MMRLSRLLASVAAAAIASAPGLSSAAPYQGYGVGPAPALQAAYDGKSALVVIRYPAGVTSRARARFNARYDDRSMSNIFYRPRQGEVMIDWTGASEAPTVQDASAEMLLKSSYFALGFYTDLKAKLPPGSVKLEPVEIDLADAPKGPNGAVPASAGWPDGFVERPATAYAPAPIYVDVAAYVDPHSRDGQRPTTFAAGVTPVFAVRTAPAASPATGGALAAMSALLPYMRAAAPDAEADAGQGASLVDYISGDQGVPADAAVLSAAVLAKTLPITPGKLLVLQSKSIALPPESLREAAPPPETPVFDELAAVVISAVNAVPYEAATHAARRRYIAFFDPGLARRWDAGEATSAADQQRLAVLRRFEQAEWRLLEVEDAQFVEAVYDGKWGDAVRAGRVAEQEFVEQGARARAAANTAAMMTMVQGMSSMRFSGTSQQMMQSEMQTMNTAVSVMQQQAETNDQMAGVGRQFEDRMLNVNLKGQQLVVALDSGAMELNARSLAELRAKLKLRYVAMISPTPRPPPVALTVTTAPAPNAEAQPGAPVAQAAAPAAPPVALAEQATPPPAAAPPASQAMELAFWQSVAMSNDAAQYRAYLAKFPNGTFADLARVKIAALSPPATRSAPPPPPPPPPPVAATPRPRPAPPSPPPPPPAQAARAAVPTAPPPAPVTSSADGQPYAPPPGLVIAPPPPRPAPHFERPQLATIPPVQPPASFCSAEERNAFHETVYARAQAAALNNVALLNGYLDKLNARFRVQVQMPDGGDAGAIMEELKIYGAKAHAAFEQANRLTELHAAIVDTPIVACAAPH